MKIKEGFVMREVANQKMLIATGKASESFRGMIKLNDSAASIFKMLQEGLSCEKIIDEIANTYAVSKDEAKNDIESLITVLKDAGVIIDD